MGALSSLPAVGCLSLRRGRSADVLDSRFRDDGETGVGLYHLYGHDDGLYDGQRPLCLATRGDDARYEDTQYVFLLPDVLRLCGQSGDLHAVAAAGGFLCRTARRRRYRPVERERRGERRGHIGDAGGVDLRRGRYRSDLRPAFLALLPLDARTDSDRRRAAGGGIGRPRPEKPGPQRSVVDSSGRRSGGAAVQLDPRRSSDFLFHGLCSERL